MPGPSLTIGSLGPSHLWRHKSQASLRSPSCAYGIAGTPHGEVRNNHDPWLVCEIALNLRRFCVTIIIVLFYGGKIQQLAN
jgi:hypothetical protein